MAYSFDALFSPGVNDPFKHWSICFAICRHSSSRIVVVKTWIEVGVPFNFSKLSRERISTEDKRSLCTEFWQKR